jgi:hypothetical protein
VEVDSEEMRPREFILVLFRSIISQPGMLVHIYNPRSGALRFEESPGKKLVSTPSPPQTNQACLCVCIILATQEAIGKRIAL